MGTVFIGIGIGVAAGVLSGLFGIGGGIVIVPALVFLGLTQKHATGTSLAALVLPVGILGVLEYAHRHEVEWKYAIGILRRRICREALQPRPPARVRRRDAAGVTAVPYL